MLDREQGEQQRVDNERLGERAGLARIDTLRHPEIRNEPDRIEDGGEGQAVGAAAEEQECEAGHGVILLVAPVIEPALGFRRSRRCGP